MRKRRKGLVVLIALATLAGLFASWLWSGQVAASEDDKREDLNLFLDASSAGWAEVTRQFFLAPESSAQTIGALLPQMESTEDNLALLAEVVRRNQNIDGAFIGYPDGDFHFVARSDEVGAGGFRTRVIADGDTPRTVDLTWTDASFVVLKTDTDHENTYDPRARPWYAPALEDDGRNWTEPYLFSSSQQPGITHSARVMNAADELVAVVGVDIRLTEVSNFLDQLSPRQNGGAMLVDGGGQIIASSPMFDIETGEQPGSLPRAEELVDLITMMDDEDNGDAVLGVSPDNARTTVVRQAGVRDEWYLAVQALDDDFIEDETASNVFETLAVGISVAATLGLLGFGLRRYVLGLRDEADLDELTGVFSRRAIRRSLSAELDRYSGTIYVSIIDLDNFKGINDTLGHAAGDAALRSIARELHAFADESKATVGRLGGDEFLLWSRAEDEPDWSSLLTRIREVSGDRLSASIGVAVSVRPHDAMDRIFGAADRLLFQAKKAGRGTFCRETHIVDEIQAAAT